MNVEKLWEALQSGRHSDDCKSDHTPEAQRTLTKMKKMCEMSKDATASIWDRHAMLFSAYGTCSDCWPSHWSDKAPHLSYLKACHEATGIIVLCKDPAVVLDTWRNVKKPKECNATTVGEAAELLLKAVAMERHWTLALEK
jgi:hypothetical protein